MTKGPRPLIDPQELARRNNENEAVHRAYLRRRRQRRKSRLKPALPEKLADALDRLAAEREARPVRAVGFFLPKPGPH
jgi:hypothetical protein